MGEDRVNEQVSRRQVFYIPGFDPNPPRRYRELFRREAQIQANLSGYKIAQRPAEGHGPSAWQVDAEFDGTKVRTLYEVLVWSDIVKASMVPSFWNIFVRSLLYYLRYIYSGALWRMIRIRPGPAVAALYPPIVILTQLGLTAAAGFVVANFVSTLVGIGPGVIVAAGTMWALLRLWRYVDRWLYAQYLILDYGYFARDNGQVPHELRTRLSEFADQIEASLADNPDEILLIGHSSGANMAVIVADDLVRRGVADKTSFALLTLAHSIPMTSFMPWAQDTRSALRFLSVQDNFTWADVSAPGDGACFALADPVAVTGVATPDQKWPIVISAAFRKTLSPEQLRHLRWRFFKRHFQYLCAFASPGAYDFFAITAGPIALSERVASWHPSPSRISRVFSGYHDV
ncbi:MAG: hypothetical protein AAGJ34_03680 [Pseudomonadota bacterium]